MGDFYFQGVEALNLNKVTVTPIQLAGESGYSIAGDQTTLVGNGTADGTITNLFEFQVPENYTQAGEKPCFSVESPTKFFWYGVFYILPNGVVWVIVDDFIRNITTNFT